MSASALVIAQNADRFDEAFRAMKRDEKLQFELPPAPEPPKLDWLEKFFQGLAAFIELILPVLKIIFYVGIGAIIALILYAIAKVIYETRFKREAKDITEEAPPPLYVPDQDQARILLEDVDALAADGRFEEAVHELLFRSIQDIDIRRPNTIRRSLTSREIAALEILTPETRLAFSKIGGVVERSYFGGKTIGRTEFDICRDAYAQFAQRSAWKQAA
ncbi:hypothetical protein [Hellea balneolensis]|uniref:hypothetical protein n=1 Tax=Hellea balneolensis TaxID=287478 RepID=UPI00042405EF|nr:hypothetical protein [Hellea balneolensis]